ncbi:MAG: DNA-binding protein [Lachnospiraceae bacterium]|nr:DNA-binding protein [Lachnospiraceae bacterium]
MEKTERRLLVANDVAKKWGCDPNYVRELYRRGLLKGIKLTKRTVKFREEEINSFEVWAEDKDLADLDHMYHVRTGEIVLKRF